MAGHGDPAAKRAQRAARWAEDPERERARERTWRQRTQARPEFKEYNRLAAFNHYRKNMEWRSLNIRLRQYGLTVDQYHALFEAQDFQCAICGADDSGRKDCPGSFYIDHDHETKRVRGLLCHACNVAVGEGNLNRLRATVRYIETHIEKRDRGLRVVA